MPLLIATLEGDIVPLGWSISGSLKKVGRVVSRPVKSVGHGAARIGRAAAKPALNLSRGNVRGAFTSIGKLATTVVTTPGTMVVGAVSPSLGKKLEGVIDRNDPAAMVMRTTYDVAVDPIMDLVKSAIKAVARPIVKSFAGEAAELFGDDAVRNKLREQRTAIIAAVTAPAVTAATAAGGPPGGAAAAGLVPPIVDQLIDEIANQIMGTSSSSAPAAQAAQPGFMDSKIFGLPAPLVVGGVALGAVLLVRKSR